MAAINPANNGRNGIKSDEEILADVNNALADQNSSQELIINLFKSVLERLTVNPNLANAAVELRRRIHDEKALESINAALNALNPNQ